MDLRILKAVKLIEERISERVSLQEAAEVVGLSRYYFHRLFVSEMHLPFYGYVKRVKMHGAAARLKWTSESIIQIAMSFGYGSNAAFTRAFTAYWGMSPMQYRAETHGLSASKALNNWVKVREIRSYRCLFRRYYGHYRNVNRNWRDFVSDLPPALPVENAVGRFLGRVYDDPRITPDDQIRYDCCYIFPDAADPRLELKEIRHETVVTDAGLYAIIDNIDNPRPRTEIYGYLTDKWLRSSRYSISDSPALELFSFSPVEATRGDCPSCTLLMPIY